MRPGAEQVFRAMFEAGHQPSVDLPTVRTPVLALHGGQDRVGPVEVSARLVDALPCGRFEVVRGAGHWIHVDRPDVFCALV